MEVQRSEKDGSPTSIFFILPPPVKQAIKGDFHQTGIHIMIKMAGLFYLVFPINGLSLHLTAGR